MAVTDCDELSNIISLGVISWDDDLAQEIARLSEQKKDAAIRAWKLRAEDAVDDITWWTAHELDLRASSADIELRAIVQAKVLKGEVRVWDAYRELASQIRRTWGTLAYWVNLLEKLRNAKPADYNAIAQAWGGVYKDDPAAAIKEMNDAIAETISANYSIRQYSDFKTKGLALAKKELREWKITQEEFEQRVSNLHKAAMEDIAKWENPKDFAKLDEEWATIKEIFGTDNPIDAGKAWSQFIMARELLADWAIDDWVLKAFKDLVKNSKAPAKNKKEWAEKSKRGAENLVWKLTKAEISKYKKWDLDKLLARAYTNTEDLYLNWELRRAYREKLVELTVWENVSKENIKKATSIMKTMEFMQDWASFSDIAIADNAARSARARGYKITDWNALLRDLKKLSASLDEWDNVLKEPIKLAWVEMEPQDVIQIIYDITWDKNIVKLVRIGFVNDWTILSIAASTLLWDTVWAEKKIIKLLTKAKEAPKITDIRAISLMAITWADVKEWAKLWFYDFRKPLYRKDALDWKKADFMEKLAEKNKLAINSEWIEEISSEIDDVDALATELEKLKGWYLLVNDSKWRDNDTLAKALDKVNDWLKEDEQISVLFPRGWMSANFSMTDWNLFYRTTEDALFDDVAWTISIQSLWNARPTREILATAYEANTGKNWDKLRYQASYTKNWQTLDWESLSDQQLDHFSWAKSWVDWELEDWIVTLYHGTSNWKFNKFDAEKASPEWDWWAGFYATNSRYDVSKNYEGGWPDLDNKIARRAEQIQYERDIDYDSAKAIATSELSWEPALLEIYVKMTNPAVVWHTYLFDDITDFDELWDVLDLVRQKYDIRFAENDIMDIIYEAAWNWWMEIWEFKKRLGDKVLDSVTDDDWNMVVNDIARLIIQGQWYDWIIDPTVATKFKNMWIPEWTVHYIAFDENQYKYIDNRVPTDDPDMRFMAMDVDNMGYDPRRYDTITKLRDAFTYRVTYKWKDGSYFSFSDSATDTVAATLLDNVERFWRGEKWDFAEAIAETVDHVERVWSWEILEKAREFLKNIDVNDIEIKEPLTDPKEIAMAIFDYSIRSLDKSEIWKLVSEKTWRINRKLFSKLTRDEQIEVADRVLAYAELYDARATIARLSWGEGYDAAKEFARKLDKAWRKLVKDFYLNPRVTTTLDWTVKLWDFIRKYTDSWHLLHEAWIVTDANDNVIGVTVWTGMNNYTGELHKVTYWTWTKYYHNHPNGSMPSDADMDLIYPVAIDTLWWILPSGVTVEFPNIRELKKIWKSLRGKNRYYYKVKWKSLAEEWVAFFYEASRQMWIIDKQNRWAYKEIIDWWDGKPVTQEFLDKISDKALEEARKIENNITDFLTPEWSTEMRWERRLQQYAAQRDMPVTDALKVEMFTKDRTVEQIANAYWFPVEVLKWTDMIQWVKAWGAYWKWVIYFTEMVKEWTAPHELFHAVFDIVWKEQHDKIIWDAMKLFGYNSDKAEEVLADAFAHWFNTWEFKYWDITKSVKWQKSFFKRVEEFFKDIAEWLWLIDTHKAEVEQMFNDMVNLKYLPDAENSVDAIEAMAKYNDELDKVAAAYFWEMLWVSGKEVDSKYIENVQTLLSDRLWIDLKSFDEYADRSQLWHKINQQFSLDRLTTWRYDKEIVDINNVKKTIEWMSNDELEKEIKKDIWDLVQGANIKNSDNIDHIREDYLDYKLATSAIDSLTAKWKIISLANGWTAQTVSMEKIKNAFSSWKYEDFERLYKEMFFPDQNVSKEDMKKFIAQINDNIFDTLSITFAENLTRAGYSLPLMNIKTFIRDYLYWRLDLNNEFVKAFLYKNKIAPTADWLKSIADSLMPTEFKFDYEDALYKWRFDDLEKWEASVFRESKNIFLPDSYSAIVAAEMANWLDVWINYEKDILEWILDKYVKAVYNWVKDWTLDFQWAQELKQQAGYALDVFEQDFLIPRYGKFLSKPEKQWLMWMKYSLPIWVKWQNAEEVHKQLIAARNRIAQRYSRTLWNAAENNQINAAILTWAKVWDKLMQKKIDARRQQLIDNWGVIKEVNGQYIVYDVKQALEYTINNLPSSIGWVEWLKALWRAWIDQLTNKQAYALLRYLEAAKWLDTTANLVTELMYKQNPMLLQYNFFSAFKVDDWLPRILKPNSLLWDDLLSKLDNTTGIDKAAKENIFSGIISTFRKQGYITSDELDGIVKKAVKEVQSNFKQIQMSPKELSQATKKMELIYKKAFIPYTYLRDIPNWGELMDWVTKVRSIKDKVKTAIKQEYDQAKKDLEAAWINNVDNIQSSIYLTKADWSKITLSDASKIDIDSWKKDIFNDESTFVAWADEVRQFAVPEGWDEELEAAVREQKEWRNSIISSYDSTLQAMLNQTEVISEAETKLTTAFMNDVRTAMRQYTLTNKIVDALDSLSWLNEEAARWIKDYLIWWKWNISFWKWKSWQILSRNSKVKEAYAKYYSMTMKDLTSAVASTKAEDLALRLARYFKNLERLLGSADWLTWCTTSQTLNKAFYRIWEVVMNINTVKWVFWLLSAVEQNQILKMFKFAKWDLAEDAAVFIRRGKWNFQESLWGYRDYAEEISWITRDEFNEIFASNFSEGDFKRILQWLTWFTLTGSRGRTWMKILNVLNGSNFIFRALMSYPWQLLTIPQQWVAYFLKQIWFQKELWIESLSDVDAVRMHYWILDGAYNEIVLRWKSTVSPDDLRPDSYFNRYWVPDTADFYRNLNIDAADDYINVYSKIDNYSSSSISATNKWFRQLDPYKDNANNIIDGIFARNFKNIAFLKAIKHNDFMQFASAADFMRFMDDPTVSATIKTRLMDRVAAYSGRNFRNILWLGFWGIDRAIWWSGFWNIMYWLIQLFNFRWSWWQNIFKQTWAWITNLFKILFTWRWMWSREWRDALARYVATQPEFLNFITAVMNDIKWTWKLQRFQDNGRWPEEDMYWAMDFVEYFTETLNMTSQLFQWLQSFWPFRPWYEAVNSAFNSHMNPTIYKDTYWIWAFFNALGKNFWRQWKPYNWMAKALAAWTTDWWDWFEAYFANKFWELSFGSVRYMVNEDQNAYGYTYEMTGQAGGIPSILMWESKFSSDKNFSYEMDNTETWETMKEIFNSDLPWDSRRTYMWNLGKTFLNWSQLLSIGKNLYKAYERNAPSYYTANDLAEYIQKTEAGKEFYRRWVVTPKTPEEAELFFDTILANGKYRPWSSNFTKSLIQFEDYWHMNGKEKWNELDAEMELWLEHMKYKTNSHWEFDLSWNQKVLDPSWERLVADVRLHWQNESYTTALIYNYAKNRLNNHSSDPNYQLYVKMLWQWQAHWLVEYRIWQLVDVFNVWKKWKDNKWTETELWNVWLDRALLLRLWQQPLEWDTMSFFDKLQVLDEDTSTVAALQIIQKQSKAGDRKVLDRFFDVKENDDWTKSVTLKYNYEQTLKQIGAVGKAIDEWNVDLAVAEASTLVNMYTNKDPTWAITATLIDSVYNRIYDTDTFSPSQKQAAMIALFHKNKDFIQRNPEKLRELLWDDYDTYAKYMNEMLYQWDWMTISNLESMQSSWTSSSWKWRAASDFSSALKNLASKIGGNWGNSWPSSTWAQKDWVPFTIKGANLVKELWLKWYTPTVSSIKVEAYKPHIDLSLKKDINRNINGPKTQQISSKKQLSKIESSVQKALEAES